MASVTIIRYGTALCCPTLPWFILQFPMMPFIAVRCPTLPYVAPGCPRLPCRTPRILRAPLSNEWPAYTHRAKGQLAASWWWQSWWSWCPGWQKLCEGTKGLCQKVWIRTKVLSPNIRYFVVILRFVAIYTLFWSIWAKERAFLAVQDAWLPIVYLRG